MRPRYVPHAAPDGRTFWVIQWTRVVRPLPLERRLRFAA